MFESVFAVHRERPGSAYCFLQERANPCLYGGGQLLQREGDGHMAPSSRFAVSLKPNVAYLVLNVWAGWKKQTTLPSWLAYAGIPYQVLGRKAATLSLMITCKPPGHRAIRLLHRGDRREYGAFPFRLVLVRARFRFHLLGAISHRCFFFVRESLASRGSGAGGLLRPPICRFPLSHSSSFLMD